MDAYVRVRTAALARCHADSCRRASARFAPCVRLLRLESCSATPEPLVLHQTLPIWRTCRGRIAPPSLPCPETGKKAVSWSSCSQNIRPLQTEYSAISSELLTSRSGSSKRDLPPRTSRQASPTSPRRHVDQRFHSPDRILLRQQQFPGIQKHHRSRLAWLASHTPVQSQHLRLAVPHRERGADFRVDVHRTASFPHSLLLLALPNIGPAQ